MNFNHPVKEVVWVFQRSVNAPTNQGNVATNDWFNFSSADPGETEPAPFTGDLMNPQRNSCNILLNGHDRFTARSALYFRLNYRPKKYWLKSNASLLRGDTFKLRETPKVLTTICSLETGAKTSGNSTSPVKRLEMQQWTIRSQASKPLRGRRKVQRLDVCGQLKLLKV